MAHVVIRVVDGPVADANGTIRFFCRARCEGMTENSDVIEFYAFVMPGDTVATINAAISATTVEACGARGYTVGPSDRKIIIGGATQL